MVRTFEGIAVSGIDEEEAREIASEMEELFPDRVIDYFEVESEYQIGVEVLSEEIELTKFVEETREIADVIEGAFDGFTPVLFQVEA